MQKSLDLENWRVISTRFQTRNLNNFSKLNGNWYFALIRPHVFSESKIIQHLLLLVIISCYENTKNNMNFTQECVIKSMATTFFSFILNISGKTRRNFSAEIEPLELKTYRNFNCTWWLEVLQIGHRFLCRWKKREWSALKTESTKYRKSEYFRSAQQMNEWMNAMYSLTIRILFFFFIGNILSFISRCKCKIRFSVTAHPTTQNDNFVSIVIVLGCHLTHEYFSRGHFRKVEWLVCDMSIAGVCRMKIAYADDARLLYGYGKYSKHWEKNTF